MFSRDESEIALSHLNLIRKIHDKASPARFLLVVLGYVSPEVTPRLRPFVHELIVYRSDTFSGRLAEALNHMPEHGAAAALAPGSDSLFTELNQLKETVEALRKQRVREEEVVQNRAAALQDTHRADLEKRRDAARTEWTKERKEIEQRINDSRVERSKVAMGELERLRKIGEDARRNTRWRQRHSRRLEPAFC